MSLCGAISQGYHARQLLIVAHAVSLVHSAIAQSCPAGVQSESLCQQYQLLPVIAHTLIQVVSLPADHHNVVLHARELAVREESRESSCLVGDKLYVQPSLSVTILYLLPQCLNYLCRQRLVNVPAHTMS